MLSRYGVTVPKEWVRERGSQMRTVVKQAKPFNISPELLGNHIQRAQDPLNVAETGGARGYQAAIEEVARLYAKEAEFAPTPRTNPDSFEARASVVEPELASLGQPWDSKKPHDLLIKQLVVADRKERELRSQAEIERVNDGVQRKAQFHEASGRFIEAAKSLC